jgi:aerobic carbon-monoxide dehydrogenase small subunit
MTALWKIQLKVNGQQYQLEMPPFTSLAQILRDQLGLTGTKISCNEGECGSCTVLMDGEPVNSCLVLAPQADGADIWTIEGLSGSDRLNPLQRAFLAEGAVQCGYCTPGLIVSGVALLRKNPNPTVLEIQEAIEGNLCRCTGYQKIVQAIQQCAQEMMATGEKL